MPHGQCVGWEPLLILGEVVSNLVIACSYYAIPVVLIMIARRYPKFRASGVLWMFAAFIVLCGTTHLMDILTIWKPWYWVDMGVRVFTALASLWTAWFIAAKSPLLVDYLPKPERQDDP